MYEIVLLELYKIPLPCIKSFMSNKIHKIEMYLEKMQQEVKKMSIEKAIQQKLYAACEK